MRLALFDLDNTLLPLDSDYQWGSFLERIGAVDAQSHRLENDRFYREYVDGTMDIREFLEFQLAPLAANSCERLTAWHRQFMDEVILPAIRPQARALIAGVTQIAATSARSSPPPTSSSPARSPVSSASST